MARKWSQEVTESSNALDLEERVFTKDDPAEIARSLKRSAERSKRRKAEPYRSAMSMLTFYINRAGKDLDKKQKQVLEDAKDELRSVRTRAREGAMIRKLASGEYRLYSRKKDPKTGKRRNLGTFDTRDAAQKHEREVQYFKRH